MTTSGVDLTPAVIDLILHERGLAYAISDPTLHVVHLGGVGSPVHARWSGLPGAFDVRTDA